MLDTQADLVIAIALLASIAATGISLRYRIDIRPARESLGDPAFVAATATSTLLGLSVATLGVVNVLWFAAAANSETLVNVSPLLFAAWLVMLVLGTRECLRGVLLLTGCAPTATEAP